MNRFPTPDERWPRRGEPLPKTKIEEHPNCGTPDCCGECDTAEVTEVSAYSHIKRRTH